MANEASAADQSQIAKDSPRIGIVAGAGRFPLLLCETLAKSGTPPVVVAHNGETDPSIADFAQSILWIHVGQIGKISKFFKKKQVQEVCFLGAIGKSGLLKKFRPDFVALNILRKLPHSGDDRVLRGVLQYLESSGFTIRSASYFLPDCVPSEGLLAGPPFSPSEQKDAMLGWEMLGSLSNFDVGQTTVVHQGCIVAVEAVEGTDAAILRAGKLTSPGSIVVKRAKANQDRRIDLPAVGPNTLESLSFAQARGLVLEAGACLILDPEEFRRKAEHYGISVQVCSPVHTLEGTK